jgi:hypothetical protein
LHQIKKEQDPDGKKIKNRDQNNPKKIKKIKFVELI